MNDSIKLFGVAVYSAVVFLAVIWSSVGLSYWRNGSKRIMWGAFTVSMLAFAALFMGLSVIAAEPAWINRMVMTWLNRLLGLLAVSCGGIFTYAYLHYEWRRMKTYPSNDKGPYPREST